VRTAKPGLGSGLSLWGLYQKPFRLVSVKEQVKDHKEEEVYTRDGVRCTISTVVYFTKTDPLKAVFDIDDYKKAIFELVRASLRNEC
jgi:regulator of protease activity HflC (stomatin/prohibitin superfamily)